MLPYLFARRIIMPNHPDEITLNAHAKVNLSLEITGRREDGYHNIRSLMQGIDLHDVIKITKCPENGTKYNLPHCTINDVVVYLCTDVKTIPTDMSNLALRGVKVILDKAGRIDSDLLVSIEKRLPVAAGIAGGSGNAAACMLGLNALLGNRFSLRELMEMGVKVGADVPFSLLMNAKYNAEVLSGDFALAGISEASQAAWVSGIGEVVRPAEPVSMHLIMANPGIAVSTRAAYEAIDAIQQAEGNGSARGDSEDPGKWPLFVNDLESYTLRDYPEALRLRDFMRDELNADEVMMSGSGPTIVAYYKDAGQASEDFGMVSKITEIEREWRLWLATTGM